MDRLGTTGRIVVGVLALVGGWIVVTTGALDAISEPLSALASNLPLFGGVALILLFGYWLVDEVEEDDEVTDAIEKAGERASSSSRGLVNFATVALGATAAVLASTGDALLDVMLSAPGVVGQFVVGLLGLGAAGGLLSAEVVAVGAVLVVVATLLASEREETS